MLKRANEKNIRFFSTFPTAVIIACLIISLALIGMGSWKTWEIYSQTTQTHKDLMKLQELNGTILHFDEVLTMSARMGALTGDKSWENRYRHYEPQLRNAVN